MLPIRLPERQSNSNADNPANLLLSFDYLIKSRRLFSGERENRPLRLFENAHLRQHLMLSKLLTCDPVGQYPINCDAHPQDRLGSGKAPVAEIRFFLFGKSHLLRI